MKSDATLKKIAEHLHISISTVSRALKNHPDVAPETKERVKELASLIDYEPNAFAVNLRKKNSNIFAVIVPEIGNYFYHSFIHAVEEESRRMGHSLMILQSMNDPEVEAQNLRLCRHNHVAGVFAAITNHTINLEPFKKIQELEIPLVFFDKVPAAGHFNTVSIADIDCGRLAAERLLQSKKDKMLAIFGSPLLSITQRRQQGFTAFCKTHAPQLPIAVEYADDADAATRIVHQYFDGQHDASAGIFCMSDEIMCGVLRGLHQCGVPIPTGAALIAISNGFLPSLFAPEISFVKTSGYDLGKLSFARMTEMLQGDKEAQEKFMGATFHAGASI
jgi:LacI family transcriptional regulator